MSRSYPLPPALCNAVIAPRLLPKSETALLCTPAHPSSQRAVYILEGINKFPLNMKNDAEMKQFILLEAWSRNRTNPNLQWAHIGLCTFLSLERWTLLNWKCTFEFSTCGKTVLWDGHQSTICASRDQGLDKHWLQPCCCSPEDPY